MIIRYTVLLTKPVQKELDEIPSQTRSMILRRISYLEETPRPRGCIKLKGFEDEYRIRIGDYRIRYQVDDGKREVIVLHCIHRKDAYRTL